ncbi:MAG TPA: hypothetical protein ENI57_07830, partial [Ignavibacteria bacterium]|nr:hypothetical protein [Ignavibacteria bacterium]
MLKKVLFILLIFVQILLSQTQQNTGPLKAAFGREVIFKWQTGDFVQTNNLISNQNAYLRTYNKYGDSRWFIFFQWTLTDDIIPDSSTIDYVQVNTNYIPSLDYIQLGLYHNDKDITS